MISNSYPWNDEARAGREEGRKNRPCVIALAIDRQSDGETLVTVLPVTYRQPEGGGIEVARAVKRHLGLDDDRSWIVVSQGDQFVWPGYDLRKVQNTDRYDLGYLPPRFFRDVLLAFVAWHRAHGVSVTRRQPGFRPHRYRDIYRSAAKPNGTGPAS